jgi:transcriptional regulator with XRE-family HTH domain
VERGKEGTRGDAFGAYLRRLREKRRLTLAAAESLSTALDTTVTSSYLSRLETGLTVPNLKKLSAISRIYDIPLTTLVEKYDVEQRLRSRRVAGLPRPFAELEALLRRKLGSGSYIEALEIAVEAQQLYDEDTELAGEYTIHGLRYLKLVECQAMVHLELYESAKFESERILELPDLLTQHRLAAWEFFIACCTKMRRYQLALAGLDQAEREAEAPDAPPRMRPDFAMLRGNLYVITRRYRRAVASYLAALKRYKELGNRLESCRTRIHLGGALTELGKLSSAARFLTRGLEVAERSGYEQLRAIALCNLTALAFKKGDLLRAESCAHRSNEISQRLGFHAPRFKNHYYLMRASLAAGDPRAAEAYRRILLKLTEHRLPPSPELDRFREELASDNGDQA